MAVYTNIDDASLGALLQDYDLGAPLSLKGIAEGVENSNFLLVTERGPFILTLYEKRVAEADLPYFLGLMRHLAERGLPCPVAIPGRDGEALRHLMNRPAAIITFLSGVGAARPTPSHCQAVGETLARLHIAARDFPMRRANALSVDGWQHLIAACGSRANDIQPGLADAAAQEMEKLAAGWPRESEDLPRGAIHADLFPDNVFFLKDHLSGVIDFYFACHDILAYDIAICLNAWCFEKDFSFNMTKAKALIAGYELVRPLQNAEVNALPILARGAAMRFFSTRLYDWLNPAAGAFVQPKDPLDYWRRIRFHQQVSTPASYGYGV